MALQTLILKIRQALSKKPKKTIRQNVSFDKAKKIGVLIYNPDSSFNGQLTAFIKNLIQDGKTVECICFNANKNIIFYDFPCFYFTSKNMDWKGDFTEERINKFIKTEFDYLYSINNFSFLPFQRILQKSMARCRIGKYEKNAELDFMIDPGKDQSLRALLEQMVIYSKKIKTE